MPRTVWGIRSHEVLGLRISDQTGTLYQSKGESLSGSQRLEMQTLRFMVLVVAVLTVPCEDVSAQGYEARYGRLGGHYRFAEIPSSMCAVGD